MTDNAHYASELDAASALRADIIVIGGGINGLAIARDAAVRGLRVVVVERNDIGGATSSISTRLIHGGLKYLEKFDLDLVWESIQDRKHLLRTAPHLVRPYPMLIPFYRGASRSSAQIRAGLWLHDVLSTGDGLSRSRVLWPGQIARRWSGISRQGLRAGALYFDAQVPWAERLCVELTLDLKRLGSTVLTYTAVEELVVERGTVTGVRVRETGTGRTEVLSGRVTINAAGPWVDQVIGDRAGGHPLVTPTKGSHVVVDPFPGAPPTCVFFEARSDGRPIFVLPWAGRYMLGSTDLTYSGDLDEIVASDAEIAYLINETNGLIPSAGLTTDHVLYSYAGVRPLLYAPDAADNSDISRGHQVIDHGADHARLLSVVGGKFTTHCSLGAAAVDAAVQLLGGQWRRSGTRKRPMPGADTADWLAFTKGFLENTSLPPHRAKRLLGIYGVRAKRVVDLMTIEEALGKVIDDETEATAAEVIVAVQDEGARTIGDVLWRRTMVGLNGDLGLKSSNAVASVLSEHLRWPSSRIEQNLNAYVVERRRFRPREV